MLAAFATMVAGVASAATDKSDSGDSLGRVCEKYESSLRGPATVSTGVGDPGGVSYGSYQLASKLGRADEFVHRYYPDEFKGLKGGTPAFTKRWRELAAKDAAGLHAHERAYIKETHYDPQAKRLQAELGLDVANRSAALREMVWSTAVQHGPNTDLIVQVVKPLVAGRKLSDVTDEAIIRAVYAERGRKNVDGKLVHFPSVSLAWIPGLTQRFQDEEQDLLALLKK